jgi:hypothetical protein
MMVSQNNRSRKKPDQIVPSNVCQQRKPKEVTAAIVGYQEIPVAP